MAASGSCARLAGVAVALMAMPTGLAGAEEAPVPTATDTVRPAAGLTIPALRPGWSFALTPYAWLPGNHVRWTAPGWPGIEAKSGNPLGDLTTFPAALTAEASYNRFTLLGDVVYAGTRSSVVNYTSPGFGGHAAPNTTAASVLGLLRVFDAPRMSLELGGGGRFWHISTKYSEDYQMIWDFGPFFPPYLFQGTDYWKTASHWLEPVLAARARAAFSPRAGISLYGDVGSFGINNRLTWQVIASLDYAVTDWAVAKLGWRSLNARQSPYGGGYSDLRVTTGLNGPFLAATFRF